MAFLEHSRDGGNLPFVYIPAAAITPETGLALVMSDGYATIAAGAVLPQYICVQHEDEAVEEGTIIAAVRVLPDTVYEVPSSVSYASVNVGDRVTIGSGGLTVTATTGGYFEVTYIDGTDAGDLVRGRFCTE